MPDKPNILILMTDQQRADCLSCAGHANNTVIFFWSDHGERLCDRGGLFKSVFYDESARVPLIIRTPEKSNGGEIATTLCSTVDAMPTLLAAAGLEADSCPGSNLLPAVKDPRVNIHDAAFSEIRFHGHYTTMIREERYKMVINETLDVMQLFDMRNDPEELVNLAGREDTRQTESELKARILQWRLSTENDQRK